MTRIKQFANDLGIPYGTAKNLIMEGRRRKDKGSDIMRKYSKGASVEVENLNPPTPDYELGRTKGGGRYAPKVPGKLTRRGDDEKVEKKAMGGTHIGGCGCDMCGGGDMVRGMGKAYMGNPRAAKIR